MASRPWRSSGTGSASISTYTNPKGRAWWRDGIETALLDYGFTTVWNDNNEYEIWDEDALCDGDGRPFRQALARPGAATLLMTKLSL